MKDTFKISFKTTAICDIGTFLRHVDIENTTGTMFGLQVLFSDFINQ